MRRLLLLSLFLALLVGTGHSRAAVGPQQNLLIQLEQGGVAPAEWERILPKLNIFRTSVPAESAMTEVLRLRLLPGVRFAEIDETVEAFFTPNDPQFATQWHFEKIGLNTAWDYDSTSPQYGGDPSVVVAVIDTGIAYENYNDNGTQYAKLPDFASTTFVSGYDFVNDDAHPNDDNGHGTHVSATVAETTDNGVAGAGIAFNSSLMPIKVLNRLGTGSVSDVALAIDFAVENGADIINLSLGSTSTTQTLVSAVQAALNANVTIVAAAGNDAQGALGFPAAYPGVIAVSALGRDDLLASYSNFGEGLSISAPGGDDTEFIWQQSFSNLDENRLPNDYTTFDLVGYQGTSQAAPHVSGSAALLLARGVPASGIKTLLEQTATDLGSGSGYDLQNGYGRVNASAALQAFVNDTTPPASTASISPSSPNGDNGYYKTKPEVTLTATDTPAGSGVRTIFYRWDTGDFEAYSLPIEPPEGTVTLTYYAEDISGNAESPHGVALLVDSIPPVITVTHPTGKTVRTQFIARGTLADASTISSLTMNGRAVVLGSNNTFVTTVTAPVGSFSLTFVARDKGGSSTTLTKKLTIENGEYFFATTGKGGSPEVRIVKKSGKLFKSFLAFGKNFRGGVTIASADVNGDGTEEILVAPESGAIPQVKVFSRTGKLVAQFLAFAKTMTAGLRLAAGDVNGDGIDEILATPSAGEKPLVRVLSASGKTIKEFLAFPKEFRGGVALAACDVNGDGRSEIIVGAGPGGTPQVRVFTKSGKRLYQFQAYEQNFRGGVDVACGDVNGDGKQEILTTPGRGRTVEVKIFTKSGKKTNTFTAYKLSYTGGARIAAGDVNGDGKKDIVISPSSSGVTEIRAFTKSGKVLSKVTAFPKTTTGTNIATGFAY